MRHFGNIRTGICQPEQPSRRFPNPIDASTACHRGEPKPTESQSSLKPGRRKQKKKLYRFLGGLLSPSDEGSHQLPTLHAPSSPLVDPLPFTCPLKPSVYPQFSRATKRSQKKKDHQKKSKKNNNHSPGFTLPNEAIAHALARFYRQLLRHAHVRTW